MNVSVHILLSQTVMDPT